MSEYLRRSKFARISVAAVNEIRHVLHAIAIVCICIVAVQIAQRIVAFELLYGIHEEAVFFRVNN